MKENVYIVDIIGDIVESINETLTPIVVNYIYGRQSQILIKLHDKDGSVTKDAKYPAIVLYQDFKNVEDLDTLQIFRFLR
jgi:hypothetical protein